MARKGYIYLTADDNKVSMFKEFLKEKKMTQRQFCEFYMDAVMVSVDENLFLQLKKKYSNIKEVENYIQKSNEKGVKINE